jgi:alpha-L-rhamnosidase
MQINSITKIRFILVFLFFGIFTNYGQVSIGNLKTDYQQTPLGIDSEKPSLSWEMKSNTNTRGLYQKAYQIIVSDQSDVVFWDSGKVDNSTSLSIFYKGKKLQPAMRYKWKLKVSNQNNKVLTNESWFETGLMDPDQKSGAWRDAQWIGGSGDDLVFYSQYFSVFKLKYDVELDQKSKSVKAGFVFGANDKRLMYENFNLQNIASKKDQSYIKVELDISNVNPKINSGATLNVYRIGYRREDSN